MGNEKGTQLWTIGHSTRAIDELVELLKENQVELLVDIRSFPSSRRFPQFNQSQLASSLQSASIAYKHLPALGGRRRPNPNSKNVAWRNASFRAYADHMETDAFQAGVRELLELASAKRVAIMCAEALWWQCHRSLVSDYLKSIDVRVTHILGPHKKEEHRYTSAASIVDGKLSYEGLLASSSE